MNKTDMTDLFLSFPKSRTYEVEIKRVGGNIREIVTVGKNRVVKKEIDDNLLAWGYAKGTSYRIRFMG